MAEAMGGSHDGGPGRRRIRVCMLSYYFPPHYSGSAVQAQSLCRDLSGLDVDSFVVSANLTRSAAAEVVGGVHVYRVPMLNVRNLRVLSFWVSAGWFLLRRRATYDLLHAHGTFQHGIASLVGQLLQKPAVLKIAMADSDIAFGRQGRLAGRLNRLVVRRFARVVATSSDVLAECRAERLPAVLIRNGVDTKRFRPAANPEEKRHLRSRLGLPDVPTVAFVGVMNPRKNVDAILRVWREVYRRTRTGHLLLIGPMQTDESGKITSYGLNLQKFVSESGLESSVTFAGPQTAVESYLRCADIFYFPSKQEGMPNALLEAMATGLASVVSDTSGAGDLIENDRTGYIVGLMAEDRQADAVEQLVNNASARSRIGAEAREFVLRSASLSSTAQSYRRLYEELLDGRPGGFSANHAPGHRCDDQ